MTTKSCVGILDLEWGITIRRNTYLMIHSVIILIHILSLKVFLQLRSDRPSVSGIIYLAVRYLLKNELTL